MGAVSVEEVGRGKALTRFLDLPQSLHGEDPRFAPPVQAWERYRVARRNPYFDRGDAGLFVAWQGGRCVGRVAAHVSGPVAERGGEGRFGLWSAIDDDQVARELVAAASSWLRGQGCETISGPWSYTAEDEPGALVDGHDGPGTTGRPWQPPWEARHLVAALGPDAEVVDELRTWRLFTHDRPTHDRLTIDRPTIDEGATEGPSGAPVPGQAGSYADRRLVLDAVAAVPDVSAILRGSRLGSAWSLARKVREADWEGCTVVRCDGDPAVEVPRLLGAARRAGYRWVVAPWTPEPGAPPETVHRRYRAPL